MAAPTAAQFISEFPEIEANEQQVQRVLNLAAEMSVASRNATMYLAAHLLVLELIEQDKQVDGGAGEVVREGLGSKSVDYMTMARTNRETFFTRTSYGRQFLILEARSPRYALSISVT